MPLFKGPTSRGMEGNGRGGRKRKVEGRGGIWPTQKFWSGAPYGKGIELGKQEGMRRDKKRTPVNTAHV